MDLRVENIPMTKWDRRFCELAEYISKWSKDQNSKVGAVLCAKKGGNISVGYNGFPQRVEDSVDRLEDKETKLELIIHAELNALIAAGEKSEGATMYVWGKPVCTKCAGAIIQAGVKRIVAMQPKDSDSPWDKSGNIAYKMLVESGVVVDLYSIYTDQ